MISTIFYCCLAFSIISFLLMISLLLRSHFFEHKAPKTVAFCDLLDYATLVDEQVIALKSGALLSMYEVRLPDLSVLPDKQIAHIYELCQKALLKLIGNYCVQVDLVRSHDRDYIPFLPHNMPRDSANASHEQALALVRHFEQERAQIFAREGSFNSHLYLSITYVGVSSTTQHLEDLLNLEGNRGADARKQTLKLVAEFKSACQNVVDTLELCFKVTPLGSRDFMLPSALNTTAIGLDPNRALLVTGTDTEVEAAAHAAAAAANTGANTESVAATVSGVATGATVSGVATGATGSGVATGATGSGVATGATDLSTSRTSTTAKTADAAHSASSACASVSSAAAATDDIAVEREADVETDATTAAYVARQQEHLRHAASAPLKMATTNKEQLPPAPSREQIATQAQATATLKWEHTREGHWPYHAGLTFIHLCLTGKQHPIALPGSRCYLDAILSTDDYRHNYTPQIGDKYIAVIALEGLPTRTHEGLVNALAALPFSYRFNSRFIYFDTLKSTLLLEKYRRYWAQKSKGLIAQIFNLQHARVNQNAMDQVEQLDKAKRALDSNEVVFGSYTATLILMERDLSTLQEHTKLTIAAIEDLGLSARVETVNATEAFLGSLPGHYFENLRRPIVSQDVLIDLLPLSAPDCGDMLSPNPLYGAHASTLMQVRTKGRSSFYLNVHEQDLGNSLVIGPSGSGKSVLLAELMINLLRYPGMRVFAFDKGCSFYGLTKALGGQHITFDNSTAALCPLESLQNELDFDYALEYLQMLLRLNGVEVEPAERNELSDCLHILSVRPPKQRTLSDLHLILTSRRLKEALAPYTKRQNTHCLLDSDHNLDFNAALTTFECASIFESSQSFSLPVFKQIFHLIAQQFDGRPAAIILDEAWLMLQDETFASELITWFKTLRKFNAIVILATQSLTDLEQSPHFINLLECAKTRFYLANFDANTELLRNTYQRLGLSLKEVNLIANAEPKRDYYFVKNEQRSLFNLVLSPLELNLLSLAGDHNKELVDRLMAQYGDKFYEHLPSKPQPHVA